MIGCDSCGQPRGYLRPACPCRVRASLTVAGACVRGAAACFREVSDGVELHSVGGSFADVFYIYSLPSKPRVTACYYVL